jgi:hypothetical protein
MSYGMDTRVGISFQNSYGTLNTASMHWLQPTQDTVSLDKAEIPRKGLRGVYAQGALIEGANTVKGDVTVEADGISLGVLLETMFSRTTVTSGSLFTHTFKPRTADFDVQLSAGRPFTYHKHLGDAGSAQLYSDLNGEQLDLDISDGQLLTAKLGVVGGTYSQITKLSPAYYTGAPFDWSVSSIGLAAVGRINVQKLAFTFKNNLQAKQALGEAGGVPNKYPDRIKRTAEEVTEVSGTLLFDDQTDLQQFVAQSRQRLTVSLTGASQITSGYNEQIILDFPALVLTAFPQSVPNAGELSVAFKATAEYSVSSGTAFAITLVNTKAGY